MNLVIIIGPSAVGKRTVGLELAKLTNYTLVHNHQPKDFIIDVNGEFDVELLREVRKTVVKYYAENQVQGLILSFRYNYMSSGSMFHLRDLIEIVTEADSQSSVYIVELVSPLEIRLDRNISDDRQELKYVKTVEEMEGNESSGVYSYDELDSHFNIIKDVLNVDNMYIMRIDNSNMGAVDVAELIHKKIYDTEK